jgi:hypothetical protein
MSYTPNNLTIYTAAYAGAFAGFVASARVLVDTNASDYADPATIIGAFAQAVDVAWENGPDTAPDTLQVLCLQDACKAVFENRNSPLNLLTSNPITYLQVATALVAALVAAETYVTGQGITPNPWPSGGGGGVTSLATTYGLEASPSTGAVTLSPTSVLSTGIASQNLELLFPVGTALPAAPSAAAQLISISGVESAPPNPQGILVIATISLYYAAFSTGSLATFALILDFETGSPTTLATFNVFVPPNYHNEATQLTWTFAQVLAQEGFFNPNEPVYLQLTGLCDSDGAVFVTVDNTNLTYIPLGLTG